MAILMLASMIAWIGWMTVTAHGTLDGLGRPIGTDFSHVWTAGWMANQGRAAEVWDLNVHIQVQRQLHDKSDVDVFGWHYPPPFLLIASLLARLPYIPALIAWQTITLGGLAALMWRLVPRWETLLLTIAAPVTLISFGHGQNGFLTGLLLGSGLALLDRRPFLAGLLLGCLIYKPQFGLVLPPLLLCGRHWRAIAGACTSAALLVALTFAIWGWPVWQAFADSLPLTRTLVIEQGSTGWHKITSPFAAARAWGGTVAFAYGVQGIATLLAVAAMARLSWRQKRPALRNAFCCAAVLLSTPYVLDYDFVVLLPALAFLWIDGRERGFRDWDATIMAVVWLSPLVARNVAAVTLVPLALLTATALAVTTYRRAVTAPLIRASPSHR